MLGGDLGSFEVRIGNKPGQGELCLAQQETLSISQKPEVLLCTQPLQGEFISIKKLGYQAMTICELEAWGKAIETYWSQWEAWSPCSRTCGFGYKQRLRECISGQPGDTGCHGLPIEDSQSGFLTTIYFINNKVDYQI